MSSCRSCGQPVIWAHTKADKRMPVDPDPHPDGNMVLRYERVSERTLALVDPAAHEPRHRSHFVTCPQADQHRKART